MSDILAEEEVEEQDHPEALAPYFPQPPTSALEGSAPKTADESREFLTRALAEMGLAKKNIRQFQALLRSADEKIRLAAWGLLLDKVVGSQAPVASNGKPVQINLINKLMSNKPGRPKKALDITPSA